MNRVPCFVFCAAFCAACLNTELRPPDSSSSWIRDVEIEKPYSLLVPETDEKLIETVSRLSDYVNRSGATGVYFYVESSLGCTGVVGQPDFLPRGRTLSSYTGPESMSLSDTLDFLCDFRCVGYAVWHAEGKFVYISPSEEFLSLSAATDDKTPD